jgi:hypothetical protein
VLTGLAVLGIYTVGGGALGGYVGSYIKEDRLRNAEVKAGGTREAGTPTEPETSGEQET